MDTTRTKMSAAQQRLLAWVRLAVAFAGFGGADDHLSPPGGCASVNRERRCGILTGYEDALACGRFSADALGKLARRVQFDLVLLTVTFDEARHSGEGLVLSQGLRDNVTDRARAVGRIVRQRIQEKVLAGVEVPLYQITQFERDAEAAAGQEGA